MDFEISLFIKKLRTFSCYSNKLNKTCANRLNNASILAKSLTSTVQITENEPNDDEQYVNVYDIDEFGFELQRNIYCRVCEVSLIET